MLLKLHSSPPVIFHADYPLGLYLWSMDWCSDILRCRAIWRDHRVFAIPCIPARENCSLVTVNARIVPSRAGNRTQAAIAIPCPRRALSLQCHERPSCCNDPEYEDLCYLYWSLPLQGDHPHQYRRRDQVLQCKRIRRRRKGGWLE